MAPFPGILLDGLMSLPLIGFVIESAALPGRAAITRQVNREAPRRAAIAAIVISVLCVSAGSVLIDLISASFARTANAALGARTGNFEAAAGLSFPVSFGTTTAGQPFKPGVYPSGKTRRA